MICILIWLNFAESSIHEFDNKFDQIIYLY